MLKEGLIEAVSITALITGGISYLYSLLTKRQDRIDKIEERVAAIELALGDIKYLKGSQESLTMDVKFILKEFTDLRVELASGKAEKKNG